VPFDISHEGDSLLGREQVVNLAGQVITLSYLTPIAEQPDSRPRNPLDVPEVAVRQTSEVQEMPGLGVGNGADVDDQDRPPAHGRQQRGDPGTLNARQAPENEERGRD